MEGCRYTDLGIEIKTSLMKRGKTQEWLIEKVRADTGMFLDSSYLYKILTGQRDAAKLVESIKKILELGVDTDETQ